jgi:hypothetical protein
MSEPSHGTPSAQDRATDDAVEPCPMLAEKKHWVEIELVGEDDRPIPWEPYEITLPGGSRLSGFLDAKGKARVECPEGGPCTISFLELDTDAWDWYSASAQGNGAST